MFCKARERQNRSFLKLTVRDCFAVIQTIKKISNCIDSHKLRIKLLSPSAMSETNNNPRPVPSPLGGERARVRGVYRTRTKAALNFSRHLRKESTDAEKRLWRLLRDRRFSEFKFRRQYPCGAYFLDFYCVAAKLAVELDGGGHGFPEQRTKDESRNQFLAGKEIKVLRFWNHQLRGELESVRFEIWYELMSRTGQTEKIAGFLAKRSPPHPNPLPSEGRGNRSEPIL